MTIDRIDWVALLDLVDQALNMPPAARQGWAERLEIDEAQRAALLDLLRERQALEAGDFLAELPPIAEARNTGFAVEDGLEIGPWRVLREIGRGGMSTVWLAERADGQIVRQVALKLPHAGPRYELLARRLIRERNILAGLEHPNIARMYDAGFRQAGMPYFVMEHVHGENLLAHANSHRLSVAQRLVLFQQVLQAVHYAHGKLVLHRDLKPSNILVDPAGAVKLLDFGIARLLDDEDAGDGILTQLGGQTLTPGYAAPEQMAGRPLGIGCDIYALGVILFELLSDERLHDLPADGHLARSALVAAVVFGEARRPSEAWKGKRDAAHFSSSSTSMRRSLRGDLDVIVSKALRKAPEDRYASAEAFAGDIRAHLDRRPIAAKPRSVWYQTGKFVARNSGRISASVLAGMLVTWMWTQQPTDRTFGKDLWFEAGPTQIPGTCDLTQDDDVSHASVLTIECSKVNEFFGGGRDFPLNESMRGHKVILHLQLQVATPNTAARAWFRVDTAKGEFAFDDAENKPLSATEWQTVSLEVLVPTDATELVGGAFLQSPGIARAKGFRIEVADAAAKPSSRVQFLDAQHPETPR